MHGHQWSTTTPILISLGNLGVLEKGQGEAASWHKLGQIGHGVLHSSMHSDSLIEWQ